MSRITAGWNGYSIHTAICQMGVDRPEGDLTVGLVGYSEGSAYMPVWLHLARIRHLRMDDAREAVTSFIDEMRISWLPAERSMWPAGLRRHTLRSWEGNWGEADLECEMAHVEIGGMWSLEAIAQAIHISITPPELESTSIL
jgi:hypothetical protein